MSHPVPVPAPAPVPVPAYHRAPLARTLEVERLEAGVGPAGVWVVTRDTILYPGGGGQPADRGTVDGLPVTAVTWTGEGWRHELEGTEPPAGDGPVGIALDWPRRFDHMQQHTAQHLLSALAQDRWGWATTAFHLGAERSDVELDTPSLSGAQLAALEDAAAAVVRDARPVTTRFVSVAEYQALGTRSRGLPEGHEGEVRLVAIEGVDLTSCGGTHLASTAEIEAVKLLGTEPMRGGTRLHWVAGGRLRARLGAHEARGEALRRLVGAPDHELVAQVEAKLEQLREAEKRARWTEARLAGEAAARIALGGREGDGARDGDGNGDGGYGDGGHGGGGHGDGARDGASDGAGNGDGGYGDGGHGGGGYGDGGYRGGGPVVEAHFEGMDAAFLRAVAQRLQDVLEARTALLTCETEDGGCAFAVVAGPAAPLDLRAAGPRVAELLEGRGGGAGRIFQGRAGSLARREEAVAVLRAPESA